MTLWEIAQEIEDRQYRTGAPLDGMRDALFHAADEITEGYRFQIMSPLQDRTLDLAEAEAGADMLQATGSVGFTVYGYEYSAATLRLAIEIMRLTPEVRGLVRCMYHPFRLAINEINFTMVCDDCAPGVRARKLAEGHCSSFRHEAGFVRTSKYPYVQEVM